MSDVCVIPPGEGSTVLNELAQQSGHGILVEESKIPVSPVVQGACDMLGLDPLYMANEGKMVVITDPRRAAEIIRDLRQLPEANGAAIIGEVRREPAQMVLLQTELGAQRILAMLEGEHLPRIC